ncbi:MAG: hypothetical protein ACRCTI_18140, partial [Beijerinckiaceae bacterium]
MTSCAVVYLARGADGGAASAERFLDSYRAHPAGMAHRFVMAAKGWSDEAALAVVVSEVTKHGGAVITLPDDGF